MRILASKPPIWTYINDARTGFLRISKIYNWLLNHYVTHFSFIQAPNEPFNLEMALSIAKNHEHETILYTEQAETISVPVTSIPNSAETFDGYQVIVMPSHEPILDTKSILDSKVMTKFPSAPSEVSTYV